MEKLVLEVDALHMHRKIQFTDHRRLNTFEGKAVDISSGNNSLEEINRCRLNDDVGRTLEVEEELLKVSEILRL